MSAKSKKARQEQLTWWLLKEGMTRQEVLADDADQISEHVVPALTTRAATLFIKSVPPHPPLRMGYLNPYVQGGLDNLFAASAGAVLVLEAAERTFAITFGQGRHLLNTMAFETDFGLRVVLNSVMPDKLKSIDAKRWKRTRCIPDAKSAETHRCPPSGLMEAGTWYEPSPADQKTIRSGRGYTGRTHSG